MTTTMQIFVGILAVLAIAAVIALIVVLDQRRSKTKELTVNREQLLDLQSSWQGPPEMISMRTPRAIDFTWRAKGLFVFVALLLAAAAALAWFIGKPAFEKEQLRNKLLSSEGTVAQATITRKWETHGRGSHSFNLAYAYEVNARRYQSKAKVASDSYDSLDVGSKSAIHYAASQPEISRLDVETDEAWWWILFTPVLGLLVCTLMPMYVFRERRLLAWGRPTGAIVTRVSPTKGGHDVHYQFLDHVGNIVKGTVVMKVTSPKAPEAGQTVTVFFDPERPQRNMVYPAYFVRLGAEENRR